MRINLKQTYTFFFLAGVFFIPFNSYQGISFLGEYRKDGAILFFLISSLLFFIDAGFKNKIKLPIKNIFIQFLALFVLCLILFTLFNGASVLENYMKQTSGVSRFLRQFVALSLALILCITAYNIFRNFSPQKIFFKLR
ncbi:hypothetical protein N9737_00005, partial [Polaribacter sp.]|nr:hypothetical protein [Polaribacter sp.]